MSDRSPIPRLTDFVEAIEHVRSEMTDVPLDVFEGDWRRRWLVERGVKIISEASRRLPDALKARHPKILWPKVAGIGNERERAGRGMPPSGTGRASRIQV